MFASDCLYAVNGISIKVKYLTVGEVIPRVSSQKPSGDERSWRPTVSIYPTPNQKKAIERAADAAGQSMSQFALEGVLERVPDDYVEPGDE